MGIKNPTGQKDILAARMQAFAAMYCLELATGVRAGARLRAAKKCGISDRTACTWIRHPTTVAAITGRIGRAVAKYGKTADDALAEVAKIAYHKVRGVTAGDKLRALTLLAEHHGLINKGGLMGGGQKPSIMIVLPDNGARHAAIAGIEVTTDVCLSDNSNNT